MITDSDLQPGSECPICGEMIITWYAVREDDDGCTIEADEVEFQGPGHGVDGDYIFIDHEGPRL